MEHALNDLVASLAERDQVVLSVVVRQAERNDVVNLKSAQSAATSAEWRPSQSLGSLCSPARAAACCAFCPTEVSLIATARAEVARGVGRAVHDAARDAESTAASSTLSLEGCGKPLTCSRTVSAAAARLLRLRSPNRPPQCAQSASNAGRRSAAAPFRPALRAAQLLHCSEALSRRTNSLRPHSQQTRRRTPLLCGRASVKVPAVPVLEVGAVAEWPALRWLGADDQVAAPVRRWTPPAQLVEQAAEISGPARYSPGTRT
jgi:hypothetical protein